MKVIEYSKLNQLIEALAVFLDGVNVEADDVLNFIADLLPLIEKEIEDD